MDLDPKVYVPLIAALVGAFVGGTIKELGSFYQVYREDKRTLKRVLYYQLDILFEVRRCDIGRILSMYFEKIDNRLSNIGASRNQINEFKQQTRPHLEAMFQKVKLGEPEKIQQRYQNAVDDLAKVDPLLAYRLSGKPNLDNTQSKIEALFEHVKEHQTNESFSEPDQRFRDHLLFTSKEKLLHDALAFLRNDILCVAGRISIITRIRAYFTLRRLDRRQAKDFDSEFDKMFEEITSFSRNAAKGASA